MSEYLLFEEGPPKPRTKVWGVSTRHGDEFGEIKWHGPWRQYCYCIDDLVYSKGCLRDLANFIEAHEKERVPRSSNQKVIK